jgi:flavin reductase (DIM6/NTAB) family NADH-FMN oxidoreductase RutF
MAYRTSQRLQWMAAGGPAPGRAVARGASSSEDLLPDVLGHFPTGVVIVTGIADDGGPVGIVSGSFTSVSRNPPLVAFLARVSSPAFAKLRTSRSFCVNVLAADQERLGRHFTDPRPAAFDGIAWKPAPSGAPVLEGVVSWLDCEFAGVSEGGDHYIVLGAVTSLNAERDVLPLLHYQQGYGTFSPGSLVTSAESNALAEAARDVIDLLARELAVECSVIVRSGMDAVFVATANHSPMAGPTRLGLRVPIAPPLGTLFVGGQGGPDAAEWVARLAPSSDEHSADDEARALARLQLDRVQRRGWSISLRGPFTVDELDAAVVGYTRQDSTPNDERRLLEVAREMSRLHEIAEVRDGEYYDVLQLAVPVRAESGDVLAVLRLGYLPPHALGSEVRFWLTQLREAARTVELRVRGGAGGFRGGAANG